MSPVKTTLIGSMMSFSMRIKRILFSRLLPVLGVLFSLYGTALHAEEFPELATEDNLISLETVNLVQTSSKTYTPNNLFQYINGQAEQFLAYGFNNLKVIEYTDPPQKTLHATVELYRMANPVAAFGIYSSGRYEGVRYVDYGAEGFISEPILVFFKGEYYVKISCFPHDASQRLPALEQLAEAIDKAIPGNKNYPAEIDFLARAGIDPQNISYGEKGLLGYDFLPPGFQMKKTVGGEIFWFFIAVCSDALQAQEFLRSYIGAMRIEHRTIQERVFDSQKLWEIEDPYQGKVIILTNNNVLAGIKELPQYPEAGLKILIKTLRNPF